VIASDIMTRDVHTIHPGASAQEHMSGAPVVDAHGKVTGIVTAASVHAVAQGYLVIRPW